MAFKTASPAQVRAFAAEKGFQVGARGKFSDELVKAFNTEHRCTPYRAGQFVPTEKHTVKPEKGRKVTRTINLSEVRAAAREAGVQVGARGRIPTQVKDAYVLGTLSSLVPQVDETE